MGSVSGGGGVGASSGGGGDWGFLGVVGLAEEEGSKPEEAGRDSEVAQGSKPGDGTLGTQTSNEPTPAANKKKREGARATEAKQLAAAVPPLAQKDGVGSRAPTDGSSSRGSEAHPREEAISAARPAPEAPALGSPAEVLKSSEPPALSAAATSPIMALAPFPPSSITPPNRGPSAAPDALEEALSALNQLRDDLHGADRRLASGRLELISGWLRADTSGRAAWRQAVAASEESGQAASLATAARDMAMKDAEAAEERCRVAEAELKTLRDRQAAEARRREAREEELKALEAAVADRDTKLEQAAQKQAAERGRLEKLKEEVEVEKAQLEAKAKFLAEGRAAFDSLEQRSCKARRDLYGRG
nr:translation initiation factor IF-2-like [Aegilops tauschii subsp. strangulata]